MDRELDVKALEPTTPEAGAEDGAPVRRRRVQGLRRAPMRRAFIGNFLEKGWRPKRRKLRMNGDISRFLRAAALADLGGHAITGPNPETDEMLSRMMAVEVVSAVNRSGKSALHWYSLSIERAFAVAGVMQPEIGCDASALALTSAGFRSARDARTVFSVALACTSQNIPVAENLRYGLEQYRHFVEHGTFKPKAYGTKGLSVANNLRRFNQLLEMMDGDIGKVRTFLGTPFKMAELREAGAAAGLRIGGQELADETVYGSMIFGPKIGNSFLQNLFGNLQPLTIDLWFTRTWGRYTGTLMKGGVSAMQVVRLSEAMAPGKPLEAEMAAHGLAGAGEGLTEVDDDELLDRARRIYAFWEKTRRALVKAGRTNEEVSLLKSKLDWPGAAEAIIKALGQPVDQPGNAGNRRWIRSVVARAIEMLADNGYPLQPAELQAILWYPEKELYGFLGNRRVGALNVSYDEAMIAIARKEGHGEQAIAAALRTVGDGKRGAGHRAGARRGHAGAVREVRGDAVGDRGAPGASEDGRGSDDDGLSQDGWAQSVAPAA